MGCKAGYSIVEWTIKDILLISIDNLIDLLSPIIQNRTPKIFNTQSVLSVET